MIVDGIRAPDGKLWYVPIPVDRNRAVFFHPYGTTWHLYCFARDDKDVGKILQLITLEYGKIKTAVVEVTTEEADQENRHLEQTVVE